MAIHVLDAMARGGFQEVVAFHDRASRFQGFLAIHQTLGGHSFGGIRRRSYRDETEALMDCLRLAKAMSCKCAMAELPGGGAKLVVLDRPELDLAGGYRFLGRFIQQLGGRYYAGPDVGTGWRELAWIGEGTSFVPCEGAAGPGELGEATAAGVFAGISAALRFLDGGVDWPSLTVVVQGLGSAGYALARRLRGLGARVVASELDRQRAERAEKELGVDLLRPGEELEVECDVFAPCALGGILHDLSVPRLRARIVCGAANNMLARSTHGDALHERGVLYVPDFVVNGGALMRGVEFHLRGESPGLEAIEERIGRNALALLEEAREEGAPTGRIAVREAERRIERRREEERGRANGGGLPGAGVGVRAAALEGTSS